MIYTMHKSISILTYCFLASVTLPSTAQARTTFLPDYMEEPWEFEDCAGGGEDYCLCQRSTNPVYQLVPGSPKCPSPKIFDKTCPHSDDWITECYCPASYNQICTSPYRGVGLICDGKYESCCDTRCSEGSQSSCSYPYVLDHTSSTGCGETCYVCRYGNDCNTSCSAGEEASYSGGYNDFNGQACVTCSTPPPPCTECWCDSSYCEPDPEPDTPSCTECWCDSSYCKPDPEPDTPSCTSSCSSYGYYSSKPSGKTCSTTTVCGNRCYYDCTDTTPTEPSTPTMPSCTDTCSSKGYKSSQPSGQTCSTTTVCGTTCYKDCKPSCTDTCSSKGYKSSQPSGQTCSTTTVCGTTCYKDCKPSCTLPDCKNTVSSKPSNSSYTTTSCTDCSGTHTINTGWSCNSGYEKSGNACVEIKKTCTVQKCQYTTRPSGVNWICSACSGVNSDCSTYSGWNCYQLCDASDECAKYEPRCSIMNPGGCTWGIATTCKRYFSDCSVDTMVACCPR
ncbi:MAG: hypothetical protein SO314_08420 [Alphaproteobacteria bacterium]|nr:hypothetical protein [Alphaproteobacteria bacterium]